MNEREREGEKERERERERECVCVHIHSINLLFLSSTGDVCWSICYGGKYMYLCVRESE